MNPPDTSEPAERREYAIDDAMRDAAAHWIVRCDRGLTETETIAFAAWQEADPRHVVALAAAQTDWKVLDRFPAAAAPAMAGGLRWRWWSAAAGLAAAAAVAALLVWPRVAPLPAESVSGVRTYAAGHEVRKAALPDGTQVLINTGGVVLESFCPAERTVRLLRGEAHFAVTKDPARPFIVRAGASRIRAVGTAFSVHLRRDAVDVVVTEGRVSVAALERSRGGIPTEATGTAMPPAASGELAVLDAGQCAVIPSPTGAGIPSAKVVVTTLDVRELARTLAWQEPLMLLGGATLVEVAKEFEQRTGHRIVLADAGLAEMRVGGLFKPDDVDGFVHLLESNFGINADRSRAGETVLRRKR